MYLCNCCIYKLLYKKKCLAILKGFLLLLFQGDGGLITSLSLDAKDKLFHIINVKLAFEHVPKQMIFCTCFLSEYYPTFFQCVSKKCQNISIYEISRLGATVLLPIVRKKNRGKSIPFDYLAHIFLLRDGFLME